MTWFGGIPEKVPPEPDGEAIAQAIQARGYRECMIAGENAVVRRCGGPWFKGLAPGRQDRRDREIEERRADRHRCRGKALRRASSTPILISISSALQSTTGKVTQVTTDAGTAVLAHPVRPGPSRSSRYLAPFIPRREPSWKWRSLGTGSTASMKGQLDQRGLLVGHGTLRSTP